MQLSRSRQYPKKLVAVYLIDPNDQWKRNVQIHFLQRLLTYIFIHMSIVY